MVEAPRFGVGRRSARLPHLHFSQGRDRDPTHRGSKWPQLPVIPKDHGARWPASLPSEGLLTRIKQVQEDNSKRSTRQNAFKRNPAPIFFEGNGIGEF